MVGRVLTGNCIAHYGDGLYTLIGAEELSDSVSGVNQVERRSTRLSSDSRALDCLAERGAHVRDSAETGRTRLHAKAWLFHRRSGSSTAYIGSSNISGAALHDGLEWNVRLAALETPAMLHKFQANFDAYWEEGEFEPYSASPEDQARLGHQLAIARGEDTASAAVHRSPQGDPAAGLAHLPPGAARWLLRRAVGGWRTAPGGAACVRLGAVARVACRASAS